jgi:hypothetical protein
LFMVFFIEFNIAYSLKSFLKIHILNLKKLVFEVKHAYTLLTIEYL